MEAFNNYQDDRSFRTAMENLKQAQIHIDLAHGSPTSLRLAIQNSFKGSPSRFLELNDVVWERTECLDSTERDAVRNFYRDLRKMILDQMPR